MFCVGVWNNCLFPLCEKMADVAVNFMSSLNEAKPKEISPKFLYTERKIVPSSPISSVFPSDSIDQMPLQEKFYKGGGVLFALMIRKAELPNFKPTGHASMASTVEPDKANPRP